MQANATESLEFQLRVESEKLKSLTAHFSHLQHTLRQERLASDSLGLGGVSCDAPQQRPNSPYSLHDSASQGAWQSQLRSITAQLDSVIRSSVDTKALAANIPAARAKEPALHVMDKVTGIACSPLLSKLSAAHRAAVTPTAGAAQTISQGRARFLHHEKLAVLAHQWEGLLGRKLHPGEQPWETASVVQLTPTKSSSLVEAPPPPPPLRKSQSSVATTAPDSPLRLTEQQMEWLQSSETQSPSVKHIPLSGSLPTDYRGGANESQTLTQQSSHGKEFNNWLEEQTAAVLRAQQASTMLTNSPKKQPTKNYIKSPIIHAKQLRPLSQESVFLGMLQQPADSVHGVVPPTYFARKAADVFERANKVRETFLHEAYREEYRFAGKVDALNTHALAKEKVAQQAIQTVSSASSPNTEFTAPIRNTMNEYGASFGSAEAHELIQVAQSSPHEAAVLADVPRESTQTPVPLANRSTRIWNDAVRECADEVFSLVSNGWYQTESNRGASVDQRGHIGAARLLNDSPLKGLVYYLVHRSTQGEAPRPIQLSAAGRKLWEALSEEASTAQTQQPVAGKPLASQAVPGDFTHRLETSTGKRINVSDTPVVPEVARSDSLDTRNQKPGGQLSNRLADVSDHDKKPDCSQSSKCSSREQSLLDDDAKQNDCIDPVASGELTAIKEQHRQPSPCPAAADRSTTTTKNQAFVGQSKEVNERSESSQRAAGPQDLELPLQTLSKQVDPSRWKANLAATTPSSKRANFGYRPAGISGKSEGSAGLTLSRDRRRASTGGLQRSSQKKESPNRSSKHKRSASVEELREFGRSFDHALLDGITSNELLDEVLHVCDDVEIIDGKQPGSAGVTEPSVTASSTKLSRNSVNSVSYAISSVEDDEEQLIEAQHGATAACAALALAKNPLPIVVESDADSEKDSTGSDAASTDGDETPRRSKFAGSEMQVNTAQGSAHNPADWTSSRVDDQNKPALFREEHQAKVNIPRKGHSEESSTPSPPMAAGGSVAMARKQLGLVSAESTSVRKLARMYSLAAKSAQERQRIVAHARKVVQAREKNSLHTSPEVAGEE